MKHPFLWALGAGVLVLVLAFVAPLIHMAAGPAASGQQPEQGLPWQTSAQADGSLQVMGLQVGRMRLADARAVLGDGLQVALVGKVGEVGVLEGLVDPFSAGFVTGRLVLAFDVPAATLRGWRDRAERSEAMEGGLRRFELQSADREASQQATLIGLSLVPGVRLSEDDVRQRFGAPAETLDQAGNAKALLYPERGLVATVSPGSKGVLQYVAPRDFEARLKAPLVAAKTTSGAASATK